MKQYSFDIDFLKENNFYFPSNIESDNFYMFHGTSSFFSDNIEENGFNLDFEILEEEYLNNILLLANNLKEEKIIIFLNLYNRYRYNDKTISLALTSGFCTNYIKEPFIGGQILNVISNIVNILMLKEEHLTEGNILLLNFIKTQIDKIRESPGVIYVINVQEMIKDKSWMEVINNYGLVKKNIPIEFIVAKLIIPIETTFPKVNPMVYTFYNKNLFYYNL